MSIRTEEEVTAALAAAAAAVVRRSVCIGATGGVGCSAAAAAVRGVDNGLRRRREGEGAQRRGRRQTDRDTFNPGAKKDGWMG